MDARERLIEAGAKALWPGPAVRSDLSADANAVLRAALQRPDDLIAVLIEAGALVPDVDELSGEPIWREPEQRSEPSGEQENNRG